MTKGAEAEGPINGSFRDPDGQVFTQGGRILRQVNISYAKHYDHLRGSGLYQRLVDQRLLVPHVERLEPPSSRAGSYHVIEPERIPFISYPFEWSFGALKAAALLTLSVQRLAVDHGMVLKDASAYNVQFRGSEPVLIDTLSFECWQEGTPWVAYRQFCQHFLGPLALMSRTDVRLGSLARVFIDGPPLDLISGLLPFRSRLSPSLFMHLHVHARAQTRHGSQPINADVPKKFSRRSMMGLIEHLASAVEGLDAKSVVGHWIGYYEQTNYSPEAMADKQRIVGTMIEAERPRTVWDLGANTGAFSRLAAARGAYTVAFDSDHQTVDRHFQDCRARAEKCVLPLVMDLTNPSGRIGWNHRERLSLADRGSADVVLALGLIHHLTLTNQVPFAQVAEFLNPLGQTVIVELPSRNDSQVTAMLSRMPRLDKEYSRQAFERGFERYFDVVDVVPIAASERSLYRMRSKLPSAGMR
jgi:ribosomal protein L11 methylase PrmA